MRIKVTLDNGSGEIDAETFELRDGHPDPDEVVSLEVGRIIEGWTLSVGDTITIREAV